MNRKYIDFVPTAKMEKPHKEVYRAQPTVIVKTKEQKVVKMTTKTVPSASGFSIKNEPKLGVIEDYNPRFVNNNVSKRPLSDRPVKAAAKSSVATKSSATADATAIKAKKIKTGLVERKTEDTLAEKPVEKSVDKSAEAKFIPPRSPFINQEKVVKRPLSKNVYQKTVEAPKEEPKGPVTIISKPEKDSKIGLLVTIILTIILGAAAGTVAFLLLPK